MFFSNAVQKLTEKYQEKLWKSKYSETIFLYDFGRGKDSVMCLINEILNYSTPELEKQLSEIVKNYEVYDDYMKIYFIHAWVVSNIKYTSDNQSWGKAEYWQHPDETLKKKTGDCEDMAILCYALAKKAGIPIWRLQLAVGDVVGGGHCWLQYIDPNINDFVNVDAAYWPTDSSNDLINHTPSITRTKYLNIWVSFNEEGIYARHDSNFIPNFISEDD